MAVTIETEQKNPVFSYEDKEGAEVDVFRMSVQGVGDATAGSFAANFKLQTGRRSGLFTVLLGWRVTIYATAGVGNVVWLAYQADWERWGANSQGFLAYGATSGDINLEGAPASDIPRRRENLGMPTPGTDGIVRSSCDVNVNGKYYTFEAVFAESPNEILLPTDVDWDALV